MKSICVYCGSNAGNKPVYAERAIALGDRIAKEGMQLVYGGGNVGLMGVVADAVLAAGGEVVGVIPEQLVNWEVAHKGVTKLEVVANMHERKKRMFDLSDAFVALPGGFGTLDEMFEIITLQQTGKMHRCPVVLFNRAYWTRLVNFDLLRDEGLIAPGDMGLLRFAESAEEVWAELLVGGLQPYAPPPRAPSAVP